MLLFVTDWSGAYFVEGLNNRAVLCVGLQVVNFQAVLLVFTAFQRIVDRFEDERAVGRGLFVADIVAEEFAVPFGA